MSFENSYRLFRARVMKYEVNLLEFKKSIFEMQGCRMKFIDKFTNFDSKNTIEVELFNPTLVHELVEWATSNKEWSVA